MGKRIDLNAARRARAEARAAAGEDAPALVVGDPEEVYELPPELPLAILDGFAMAAGAQDAEGNLDPSALKGLEEAFAALFGGADVYAELKARHGLSIDDLLTVFDAYGIDSSALGGSSASAPS